MWHLAPQGSAACLGAYGKMSGIDCRRFPSLAYPSPSAPYFLHSRPVPFPSRKFLETAATQATLMDCHAILLREEGTRVEL